MGRRGDDVIGFTRIFVLFISLVIVPALLMSGFGVIAILNVGQVDKQRRREAGEVALRLAEQRFVATLDEADRALRSGLEAGRAPGELVSAVCRQGAPVGAWAIIGASGEQLAAAPPFDDPIVAERLRLLSTSAVPLQPAHVVFNEGTFSGVVSMQRLGDGRAVLYSLDEPALEREVRGPAQAMPVSLAVDAAVDQPVQNALERLKADVGADSLPPVYEAEIVERRLDPPFDRFTLRVQAPPTTTPTTIVVLYIALLAVFLVTLITGVVITGRLIYEETRLSRLKTDFVSHMSHELRTPLTSIRLFIDTLKLGRATPDEEAECLDLLARETERLSEMIERVLGYARLKAGRRIFVQTPVDVAEIVGDAIAAFRAQTFARPQPKNLDIEKDIAAGLAAVHVDKDAIVEALLNLLGNAWKYTGPDKRITVFARPGRRGRVVVGVQDNGPGLPKQEHGPIFERFYQANALLSSKQPGSGLGLAITKALIEGQGGCVGVDSEPGKGSSFWLELHVA
ncbi:MAG: HAMP domain-containing histidine kinase [Deltaproteobacteria bacterium]|nr:HAMP domain-containing histidine kinase [Deltaproteobacteria bacterium]